MVDSKAQGSLEYLLVIGGVLILSALVLLVFLSMSDTTEDSISKGTDRGTDLISNEFDNLKDIVNSHPPQDEDEGPPELPLAEFKDVGAGGHHSCLIKRNGTLWCTGRNTHGELGDGSNEDSFFFKQIGQDNDWKTLYTGDSLYVHTTCVKKENNDIYCFGTDLPSIRVSLTNVPRKINLSFKQISFSAKHSCYIDNLNSLYCSGDNSYGQIGVEGESYYEDNIKVMDDVIKVSVGERHTCALTVENDLFCSGDNSQSQLGFKKVDMPLECDSENYKCDEPYHIDFDKFLDVSTGGYFTCVITIQNKLYCWGNYSGPEWSLKSEPVELGSSINWKSVMCANNASCALDYQNYLYCFGYNTNGQLGLGDLKGELNYIIEPQKVNNLKWDNINAGGEHFIGVSGEKIYTWGLSYYGQLGTDIMHSKKYTKISEDKFKDVDAIWQQTCALKEDNSLWCVGDNYQGKLGLGDYSYPNTLTKVEDGVKSFSSGAYSTCLIKEDNTLWCAGRLGLSTFGLFETSFVKISDKTDWSEVEVSRGNICALDSFSDLYCFGDNRYGELGLGHKTPINELTKVGSGFKSISDGWYYMCAIKDDDALYCAGNNRYGQLGIGNDIDEMHILTKVFDNVKSVAGRYRTCSIKADNSLWCFGLNNYNQASSDEDEFIYNPQMYGYKRDWEFVSSGRSNTCAIDNSNNLWCAGRGEHGQLGSSTNYSSLTYIGIKVKDIANANTHSCYIDLEGYLYCSGDDSYGALGKSTDYFGKLFEVSLSAN